MVDITADRLRKEIIRGGFPAGTLLPPERKLAETLGVNRLTLRAALSRLEAEFLIAPHQGRGISVLDWRLSAGLGILAHVDAPEAISETLMLRRTLAAEAIRAACIHADRDQIEVINQAMQRQLHENDPYRFFEGDLAFTQALVAASGSLPLQLMFNTLARIAQAHPEPMMKQLSNR
ncbi:MAG: GntR family transcriptional regulator, partial [Myxococcota bacterium]